MRQLLICLTLIFIVSCGTKGAPYLIKDEPIKQED
jgi:hypothetical protein